MSYFRQGVCVCVLHCISLRSTLPFFILCALLVVFVVVGVYCHFAIMYFYVLQSVFVGDAVVRHFAVGHVLGAGVLFLVKKSQSSLLFRSKTCTRFIKKLVSTTQI